MFKGTADYALIIVLLTWETQGQNICLTSDTNSPYIIRECLKADSHYIPTSMIDNWAVLSLVASTGYAIVLFGRNIYAPDF